MKSAPPWLSRLGTLGLRVVQSLLALIRTRRSTHLLITGPDSAGREALAELLRSAAPGWKVPSMPMRAKESLLDFGRLVITWHPADEMDVVGVRRLLAGLRRILVLSVVADPRQLVTERDPRVPHQYVDGGDYRFFIGPSGLRSLTEPGVVPRFQALAAWQREMGKDHYVVTREMLEGNSATVLREIQMWMSSRGVARLPRLFSEETSKEIMSKQPHFSEKPEARKRVVSQCASYPELEEFASAWGYPPTPASTTKKRSPVRTPGTVIAFHTPDAVYRAEAQRLKSSLEALGISYRFYEVTPEKNWVRTTLLKPSWIIPAREELAGELLYIDVDAFVHHNPWPYLVDYDGDMAAVVYRNGQLNSATLWINDTPGARGILHRWKELADARRSADQGDLEATGDNGDQGVLKQAVLEDEQSSRPKFRFQRLPVNMAYIFDRIDTYCVGPIFIEQLQASRESLGHDKRLARRRARLQQLPSA